MKNTFYGIYDLGRSFHTWGQIEAVFNTPKFLNRPEVEYTKKTAISISDILSFWSTL